MVSKSKLYGHDFCSSQGNQLILMKNYLLLALVAFYSSFDSQAAVFNVPLDPSQSVPSPSIAGFSPTGIATIDVDFTSGIININGTYSGMTSDVVSAHLHGAASPGNTAGVIFGFLVTGGATGAFAGTHVLSTSDLDNLQLGLTYVNVHTVNNGPGEIRGQVIVPRRNVPDAGSTALLFALGGLVVARFRRS